MSCFWLRSRPHSDIIEDIPSLHCGPYLDLFRCGSLYALVLFDAFVPAELGILGPSLHVLVQLPGVELGVTSSNLNTGPDSPVELILECPTGTTCVGCRIVHVEQTFAAQCVSGFQFLQILFKEF